MFPPGAIPVPYMRHLVSSRIIKLVGEKLTASGPVRSGNWDSKVDAAFPLSPRRSPLGSNAAASPLVANWTASSPRRAFSRARKSSGAASAEVSLMSGCASRFLVSYVCLIGLDCRPELTTSIKVLDRWEPVRHFWLCRCVVCLELGSHFCMIRWRDKGLDA